MLWINTKRILKTGFVQFWRNGVVSLSAVLVMIVTLFVISTILFTSALLTQSLEVIKNKVDVSVYFDTSASEEQVVAVKQELESLPEVAYVDYISRDQALENYVERHRNDQEALDFLSELDENPLGAALNVKATETSQFENIANYLNQNYPAGSIVDSIDYFRDENRVVIDSLSKFIDAGQRLGAILTIIFIIISIIITLNTIRLAMFISKEEISVMKLVGASKSYISGPFIVTGAIYGVVSSIFTLIILWPVTYWLADETRDFFGVSLFEYYTGSFGEMFLIIFFSGILIGSISSFLAITRYLKNLRKRN